MRRTTPVVTYCEPCNHVHGTHTQALTVDEYAGSGSNAASGVTARAKSFCGPRFRFGRFQFAVPRRRVSDQRFEKVMRYVRDFIHRVIECCFVAMRWFCEATQLPNKLERGRADFIVRRRRIKVMQGFDCSTHEKP